MCDQRLWWRTSWARRGWLLERVSRSTPADADERRDWRIYADFAQPLIARERALHAHGPFGVELQQSAYVPDSTTIDLCLSLFPRARCRRDRGAVKLHTLIDLRGSIPCFIRVSDGKTHDARKKRGHSTFSKRPKKTFFGLKTPFHGTLKKVECPLFLSPFFSARKAIGCRP